MTDYGKNITPDPAGNEIRDQFIKRADEMGITISPQMLELFDRYYKNLIEWNEVMNLTAITEEKDVYEKHFLDSLSIVRIIPREKLEKGCTLIDVGTGAGFPGLPIAIVFQNVQIVLMDSLNKRIRFLEDTVQKLGLTNVRAVHARAEELAKNKSYREKMDLCCSRAVANLSTLSEYCLPFVKKGGSFVSYKTEQVQDEIDQGAKAIKLLGGGNIITEYFELPGTDYKRSLVKIEKVSFSIQTAQNSAIFETAEAPYYASLRFIMRRQSSYVSCSNAASRSFYASQIWFILDARCNKEPFI